ncbi:hypothetical protein D9758_001707 [Tetrapyrgos nigripes]|uniref:Uncharacterized protein n=1 Tax=Tetrapyrgos nigripes TaxID=182062 RepID=A0A8H5GXE1_9AGAR|nr:hypothetical protein D9758_001707 [Tetrapyrgos nigripes]
MDCTIDKGERNSNPKVKAEGLASPIYLLKMHVTRDAQATAANAAQIFGGRSFTRMGEDMEHSLSILVAAASTVSAQCTLPDVSSASIINSANSNLEWGATSPSPPLAIVSSSFRDLSAQAWQITDISNQDLVISSPTGQDLELQSSQGLEAGGAIAQTWRITCNTLVTLVIQEAPLEMEIGDSSGAPIRIADCDGSERQSFNVLA